MEKYNSLDVPIHNKENLEATPLSRKPLSEIVNNVSNQQSPVILSSYSSESSKSSLYSNRGPVTSLFNDEISKSIKYECVGSLTPTSSQGTTKSHTPMSTMKTSELSNLAQNTPKTSTTYNPFEECTDVLHLPKVSPSLFREVVSPSVKEYKDFSWAIDELAILKPTNIEASPMHEADVPFDPEYERKAQDAIDRFFSSALVVPSPWASSGSRSLNLMSALFSSSGASNNNLQISSPSLLASNVKQKKVVKPPMDDLLTPVVKTSTVWSQTELSLPPILPKEAEAVLAPYFNFTQDQTWQVNEECDESSSLNNTTLRRKLLFGDDISNSLPVGDPPSSQASRAPSPASTGEPLPLDEEDPPLPWGVSMLRPSSHVSFPSSSPPSFAHSSLGSANHASPPAGPLLSPNDVSPIAYFPPKNFRTLPSPSSDYGQTPSRRRYLTSPKLSPILKTRPSSPSPSYPSFECRDPKESSRFESTAISCERSEGGGPKGAPLEYDSNSQGFVVAGGEPPISTRKTQLTPLGNRASLRSTVKASPQFSSSPIKGKSLSDTSRGMDSNESHEGGWERSPKFSESPPVSPIAWRHDSTCLPPEEQLNAEGGGAKACRANLRLQRFVERMEDISEDRPSSCQSSLSSEHALSVDCGGASGYEMDESAVKASRVLGDTLDGVTSHGMRMDSDSTHFVEGNTSEEAYSGQDTGYQTGGSLQTSDQSQFLPLFNFTNQSKETESLFSPPRGKQIIQWSTSP